MALVTYAAVKLHLRIEDDYEAEDVRAKIEQASAVIVEFIDNPTLTDTWGEQASVGPPALVVAPLQVQAAVLELVHFLYKRDQSVNADVDVDDCLPRRVTMFLKRLRKPVMGMPEVTSA